MNRKSKIANSLNKYFKKKFKDKYNVKFNGNDMTNSELFNTKVLKFFNNIKTKKNDKRKV
jgi:hypothetical protein